ncbi:protein of unknown function [Halobacillus alkaliphilus]|uniref:Short C-terminal domain-containing protein n=1 Tax=Halobacillus alkaliphilus TaxID=396056 RepID=A0A1I2L0M2_9BACI|nr:SHOCT domain-containing protein [Halobacillus alkaliphilus]SFF72755.1 protein of unknown function [Halobacillus alkaliphilus]
MKKVIQFKDGDKLKVTIDNEFIHFHRKGVFNSITGLKGKDSIRLDNISDVQFKKPGMLSGYIQFTLVTDKNKIKVHKAVTDKNSIIFSKKEVSKAEEIKEIIEAYIAENSITPYSNTSVANELEKLAELKEKGILTEKEFVNQKSKILK